MIELPTFSILAFSSILGLDVDKKSFFTKTFTPIIRHSQVRMESSTKEQVIWYGVAKISTGIGLVAEHFVAMFRFCFILSIFDT